jgi:hypothetical protein
MTSKEFVIWMKGFTEACNDYTATPKQWDRIKEVLDEVEDYGDNHGIDVEIDDYKNWFNKSPIISQITPLSGSGTISTSRSGSSFSVSSNGTTTGTTVWNDKMGCWHYTNYPEGFGYFTNSTLDKTTPEDTKKQLLD